MLGLVLPTSKSALLKTFTFENCRELFSIKDNKQATLSFIEDFFITNDLHILEKLYCLLHLRDLCIGNMIELKDCSFDIIQIQNEIEEINNIKKTINFNGNIITLDYPKSFTLSTIYEDCFIQTVILDKESVDYNTLSIDEQNLIFNYLPSDVKSEIKEFYKQHISKLKIEFSLRGKKQILNLDSSQALDFIAAILTPINCRTYRDYIFILSKRIKDVTFLNQSTYLDIRDYMELYLKEAKENKSGVE